MKGERSVVNIRKLAKKKKKKKILSKIKICSKMLTLYHGRYKQNKYKYKKKVKSVVVAVLVVYMCGNGLKDICGA